MDYRCRLGSLVNSFTASRSSDPGRGGGGGRPEQQLGRLDFFSCPLHFLPYSLFSSYLLLLCLCLISSLMFPCASVLENNRA